MSGKKGKGRKSRRGLLGSFKYSTSKSSKKKKSMPRKIAEWIGGGLMIAVMGFILVLLVWRMLSPDYGVERREGTFAAVRIDAYDEAVPAAEEGMEDRVATATVEIEGYEVGFELTAEQLEGVRGGAGIRTRYVFQPFNRGARITVEEGDWYVEGVDEEPDWTSDTGSELP